MVMSSFLRFGMITIKKFPGTALGQEKKKDIPYLKVRQPVSLASAYSLFRV